MALHSSIRHCVSFGVLLVEVFGGGGVTNWDGGLSLLMGALGNLISNKIGCGVVVHSVGTDVGED